MNEGCLPPGPGAVKGREAAWPVTIGDQLEVGVPRALFTLPSASRGYDISRDGKRFLGSKIGSEASPITLLLNWKNRRGYFSRSVPSGSGLKTR